MSAATRHIHHADERGQTETRCARFTTAALELNPHAAQTNSSKVQCVCEQQSISLNDTSHRASPAATRLGTDVQEHRRATAAIHHTYRLIPNGSITPPVAMADSDKINFDTRGEVLNKRVETANVTKQIEFRW